MKSARRPYVCDEKCDQSKDGTHYVEDDDDNPDSYWCVQCGRVFFKSKKEGESHGQVQEASGT